MTRHLTRIAGILAVACIALGFLGSGCSSETKTDLDTAAPPPAANAVPDKPNPNKKIPPAPPTMGSPGRK